MNEILDLPPALDDNPNKRKTLLVLISIAIIFSVLRLYHIPFAGILQTVGFGILSGFALHGIREKLHPQKWFRVALIVCVLWFISRLVGRYIKPLSYFNLTGLLLYLGSTALSYVIFQARHHKRKQRYNQFPND
ncbi:MAG: hypothetical protein ACKVOK_06005 [Flavobacteriales bacterium]